jgi:hypothetical protein
MHEWRPVSATKPAWQGLLPGGIVKQVSRKATIMHMTRIDTSEAAIFSRVIEPEKVMLSPEAAPAILTLDFHPADRQRMQELAVKARAGNLTAEEQEELDNYGRVGSLLGIMKSKARRSLKNGGGSNGPPR